MLTIFFRPGSAVPRTGFCSITYSTTPILNSAKALMLGPAARCCPSSSSLMSTLHLLQCYLRAENSACLCATPAPLIKLALTSHRTQRPVVVNKSNDRAQLTNAAELLKQRARCEPERAATAAEVEAQTL
jgi:hypothetical protein